MTDPNMNEWLKEYNKDNYKEIVKDELGTDEVISEDLAIDDQTLPSGAVVQFTLKTPFDINKNKLWLMGVVRGNAILGAGGQWFPAIRIEQVQLLSLKSTGIFKAFFGLRKKGDNLLYNLPAEIEGKK
jgi:hypothetical protein